MKLLQVQVDDKLKSVIQKKAKIYGIPASSLVRIVLVKTFLEQKDEHETEGNVFNANRDNLGRGIKIDTLIDMI